MTPTEEILEAYKRHKTMTAIQKATGYSWHKIAKTLSSYGIVLNDSHQKVMDLHKKGYSINEISECTNLAIPTVMAYLPRVRPTYMENRSKNAEYIEKCRKNKNRK